MIENKLKPCPFCGCDLSEFPEVMVVHRDYMDNYVAWKHSKGEFVGSNDYRVYCERCGARGRAAVTKEKAIEFWNRRVKMEKTDFYINRKPVSISFECPHCDYDVTIDWDDLDEPEYWGDDWGEVECPHCGKTVSLGDYEVD